MTQTVEVYSKENCPYCTSAKQWLTIRGIEYTEVMLKTDEERFAFFERVGEGVRTVPQIYVDGVRIGGFTELKESDHLFVRDIQL